MHYARCEIALQESPLRGAAQWKLLNLLYYEAVKNILQRCE